MEMVAVIQRIVELLVRRAYDEVIRQCPASRITAAELRAAIDTYGHSVTTPPPEAYDLIDAIPVDGPEPAWSVTMPLWTIEEGRSDLSLGMTITVRAGQVVVELDDIHVL
jgi:hypothetical protein